MILTGSQLLFFRDTSVALNLLAHARSTVDTDLLSMQLSFLKPEEILSVKNAVAVYDSAYVKVNYQENVSGCLLTERLFYSTTMFFD